MILGVKIAIILKFIISLFAIINPFSLAGIYLDTVKQSDQKEKNTIVFTMILAFLAILSLMVWFGNDILSIFGINQDAFRAGGGVIVLFFGLRILGVLAQPVSDTTVKSVSARDLAVVPLAIPLLAGPGTIATVITDSHEYFATIESKVIANLCLLFVAIVLWLFFRYLPKISASLGEHTIDVISKIMGLMLVAISVEMIFDGIKGFFY
ncbi:MarC family protein [Francisella philomiragia]|uniref:MarC family protein n=1 Tax=Francisella philomiragia TaxID=28110 RepID=UPI0019068B0B|nr:MarC family protein [Francisella philomiragia]MBK2092488.1 MarC family protein [Francisella philomiragia]MBK2257206.1 MarC family protein [Francisella philomiragia]MBK2269863.1 MarC family protein [Francisella philomiragia]MBK2271791.1 MarC family protein [Francisella philomiragia]MBK2275582.1 MarC family protein [Francisella philomiragia]